LQDLIKYQTLSTHKRRIIRAENFEIVRSFLNYSNILTRVGEGVEISGEAQQEGYYANADSGKDLIDDVQFEDVTFDDSYNPIHRQRIDGMEFNNMDPQKEVNNVSYRILQRAIADSRKLNENYTALEIKRSATYTDQNLRSEKGNWHDCRVY